MRKRFMALGLALCLLVGLTRPAAADKQEIPDFCKPILEAWGATNEKELQQAILTYWEDNNPKEWPTMHKGAKTPVSFWFGGTTRELIKNHKKWDVAIVSSKEVDLQELADAGVIILNEHDGCPCSREAYDQWLYPKKVQQMLPKHPLYYYHVYCYRYDIQTNEAIFLLCNSRHRPTRWYNHWITQILESRTPSEVRAVEGIRRMRDWAEFAMPELSASEADLVAHPKEWDWAFLRIHKEDKLEKLDAAGLLYDFAQDEYWANRDPQWVEWSGPSGIKTADGRMIAIPYPETNHNGPDEISVFVVNAQSSVRERALAYSKHFIMGLEWLDYGKHTYKSDWKEIKKYYKKYNSESYGMILKEDVNW